MAWAMVLGAMAWAMLLAHRKNNLHTNEPCYRERNVDPCFFHHCSLARTSPCIHLPAMVLDLWLMVLVLGLR